MKRIGQVAAALGLGADDVEPRGFFVGKLALGLERRLPGRPETRYVAVTATTPTPRGEGKTVTTIGLAMALERLGKRAIPTLREPSRAPVFGMKGGGAGGGRATLVPAEALNLGVTGDLDAVAAATNLLAAMIDNHIRRDKAPRIDPASVTLKRVLDVGDRTLRSVTTDLGTTGFELTAASEVMAILALAGSLADLRARLGAIVVGQTPSGELVRAEDVGCAGAMAALLRDAIRPNLVQTSEGSSALVHAGPFANIAHGNCSVIADLAACRLADYVVSEGGFASDMGLEKLVSIKCRASGLSPSAAVLVTTVRAVAHHSFENLAAHLEIVAKLGLPAVVAVNRFPDDSEAALADLCRRSRDLGARDAVVSSVFADGSEGALELARAVESACAEPATLQFPYDLSLPLEEKLRTLAREIYGADDLELSPEAKTKLARFSELGFGKLPVCVAKTQYSLSHDKKLPGRPRGYRFPVRDVRLSAGAGFVYALAGDILTLPGLPAEPAALAIDVTPDGEVSGLR